MHLGFKNMFHLNIPYSSECLETRLSGCRIAEGPMLHMAAGDPFKAGENGGPLGQPRIAAGAVKLHLSGWVSGVPGSPVSQYCMAVSCQSCLSWVASTVATVLKAKRFNSSRRSPLKTCGRRSLLASSDSCGISILGLHLVVDLCHTLPL